MPTIKVEEIYWKLVKAVASAMKKESKEEIARKKMEKLFDQCREKYGLGFLVWLHAPNPSLDDASPFIYTFNFGQPEKLLKIVKKWIKENKK